MATTAKADAADRNVLWAGMSIRAPSRMPETPESPRLDELLRGSRELTASAVDLTAPGVPHGDRDPARLQPADELTLIPGAGRRPDAARRGVQRDEVDVHEPPGEQ